MEHRAAPGAARAPAFFWGGSLSSPRIFLDRHKRGRFVGDNHERMREIVKKRCGKHLLTGSWNTPPAVDRSKLDRALFQEKTLRFGRCFRDMPRSPHLRYRPSIGQVPLSSIYFLYDNVIHVTKGESTMAANQLVQARIDGAIKEEAAAVLAAMGLTVSDAVRLLLTRVAQEKAPAVRAADSKYHNHQGDEGSPKGRPSAVRQRAGPHG